MILPAGCLRSVFTVGWETFLSREKRTLTNVFIVSSDEVCFRDKAGVFVCFAMESEVSRVKRARVLSQNQIREIVMDSDSDEEKHYTCEEMDKQQPDPSSRRSSITSLQAQIFLPAALKMRKMLVM